MVFGDGTHGSEQIAVFRPSLVGAAGRSQDAEVRLEVVWYELSNGPRFAAKRGLHPRSRLGRCRWLEVVAKTHSDSIAWSSGLALRSAWVTRARVSLEPVGFEPEAVVWLAFLAPAPYF